MPLIKFRLDKEGNKKLKAYHLNRIANFRKLKIRFKRLTK